MAILNKVDAYYSCKNIKKTLLMKYSGDLYLLETGSDFDFLLI